MIKLSQLTPWGLPLLAAACIFLLPLSRAAEAPMAILALCGLVAFVRAPRAVCADPALRRFAGLFACLWLPMLLALTDTVAFATALNPTLSLLRFLLMGVCLLLCWPAESMTAATPESPIGAAAAPMTPTARVLAILGPVLTLWAADGVIQVLRGTSLMGFPLVDGLMTGVFHPVQKLGVVLAVLTPVYFLWLARVAAWRRWLWLLAPLYPAAVLLSGKRSAWIMLAAALAMLALWVLARLPAPRRLAAAATIAVVLALSGLGLAQNEQFRTKLAATSGLMSSDFERADVATSYRMTIWRVAADVYRDHWLNGIGPRVFRKVYPDYARPDDFFLKSYASAPTHPHQMLVEIAVETGLLGLVGFALLWMWLLRELWRAQRARAYAYLPWLIAVGVALLPLNAGHAIYGSFWSAIIFWLLIMALVNRPAAAAGCGRQR